MKRIITGAMLLLTTCVISSAFGQTDQLQLESKFSYPNPHPSKYVWTPTAFTIKKGTGYYQNTVIFFNTVRYGVTDNIMVSVTLEPVSTVAWIRKTEDRPMVGAAIKVGKVLSPVFRIAAGSYYLQFLKSDDVLPEGHVGLVYALTTMGTESSNLTIGLNLLDSHLIDPSLAISIAGQWRVADFLAFNTENVFVFTDTVRPLPSIGASYFRRRWAVDVSLIGFEIPLVDFVWTF